jgi:hypothetical protein
MSRARIESVRRFVASVPPDVAVLAAVLLVLAGVRGAHD